MGDSLLSRFFSGRSLLKLVALLASLATLSLVFRPAELLPNNPLTEDAFYALTVSRNIANGNGMTADGVNPTNGFQPLFTVVCSIAYLFFAEDTYAPLRIVLLFHWLLFLGTALLLGAITFTYSAEAGWGKDKLTFWFPTSLYLCSLFAFIEHFNGLETGCALFMCALVWFVYQRGDTQRASHLFLIGLSLGLAVLARIDVAFLVVIFSVSFLILPWRSFTVRAKQFLLVSVTAFVVSLPWFAYNVLVFDSLMPTSGQASMSSAASLPRVGKAIMAISQCSLPFIYASRWELISGVIRLDMIRGLIIGAALVVFVTQGSKRIGLIAADHDSRSCRSLHFAVCFLIFCGALAVWYTITSSAVHFYVRYLTPLMLPSTFLIAVSAGFLLRRFPVKSRLIKFGALSMVIPVLATTYIFWRGEGFTGNVMYTQQVPLVERTVPDGKVVGAFQSGTLGYLRPPAVNLDGKVNRDALVYRDRIADYLEAEKIEWLCDWPRIVKASLKGDPQKLGWNPVDRLGGFVLYQRKAPARPH